MLYLLHIHVHCMYTCTRYMYIFSHLVQWDHCWVSAEILVSSKILEGPATSSHYQVSVTLHGHRVNHVTIIQVSEDEIQYCDMHSLHGIDMSCKPNNCISRAFMELYSGINSNAVIGLDKLSFFCAYYSCWLFSGSQPIIPVWCTHYSSLKMSLSFWKDNLPDSEGKIMLV